MSKKGPNDSGIETLSGVDGAFLNLETAATPMHVGSLHLSTRLPATRATFSLPSGT